MVHCLEVVSVLYFCRERISSHLRVDQRQKVNSIARLQISWQRWRSLVVELLESCEQQCPWRSLLILNFPVQVH